MIFSGLYKKSESCDLIFVEAVSKVPKGECDIVGKSTQGTNVVCLNKSKTIICGLIPGDFDPSKWMIHQNYL